MRAPTQRLRILMTCSGLGRVHRGIETFFREAFDGLRTTPEIQLRLLKGAGQPGRNEYAMRLLPRGCTLAKMVGLVAGRNSYAVEQWSSVFSVSRHIREFRPHVVFLSEANLGFCLWRLRQRLGGDYRLLFSNGGPAHPPFVRTDFVHQVAPVYFEEALQAGEPREKHFLVPYGIQVPAAPPDLAPWQRSALRRRLGLPINRKIVLSVGWIRREHKRMDYVIDEVARLGRPRPYLQLLGQMDKGSDEILKHGTEMMGPDGFGARCVPYTELADFYRAADCFVLGSLNEGFGRVYLEALMNGLPVIAHDNPVTRYVLGDHGHLADLTKPGALAQALKNGLAKRPDPFLRQNRWKHVRDRFSWEILSKQYVEMFALCAGLGIESHTYRRQRNRTGYAAAIHQETRK